MGDNNNPNMSVLEVRVSLLCKSGESFLAVGFVEDVVVHALGGDAVCRYQVGLDLIMEDRFA